MTPPKAALICEENPQCGGFTYKVREPIKYYAAVFGSLLVCANTPSSLCPFWRIFEILQHKFRQDPKHLKLTTKY